MTNELSTQEQTKSMKSWPNCTRPAQQQETQVLPARSEKSPKKQQTKEEKPLASNHQENQQNTKDTAQQTAWLKQQHARKGQETNMQPEQQHKTQLLSS